MDVNRKMKKIEFNVHYKKTNTNITIRKKSNHTDSTKKGIIKGYLTSDRARRLCDQGYLNDEIPKIEGVFKENGYEEKEIEKEIKKRRRTAASNDERGEQPIRGIVVIENIPNITPQLNKIAREHNFKVTSNSGMRVRDLT